MNIDQAIQRSTHPWPWSGKPGRHDCAGDNDTCSTPVHRLETEPWGVCRTLPTSTRRHHRSYDSLFPKAAYAITNHDEFIEKVRAASQIRQTEAAKETKRKLNRDKKRIVELDTIIKKLYESFAVGRLSEERFDSLLSEYETEQKSLKESVSDAESRLASFEEDTVKVEQFLALAKKYTDFSELTTPMINEFIDKIIVHAPERVDGDRVQEVEIHLKFIGRFELPPQELTPEEIKRQAQLHRHRIKSRERYQLIKAGKKKVYMTPSEAEAHGYERVNKYPKSTKYGRQNPIAARWNSEEQLVFWREAWAEAVNGFLEQAGSQARIDHRSHADRGLDEQPTIHEGITARALERQGILSDRCEVNRQIKAGNALLQELKAQIEKLNGIVKHVLAAIAEAMENLRKKMIVIFILRPSEKLRNIT